MLYFASFPDQGMERWLADRDDTFLLENIGNAMMQVWGGFKDGLVSHEEFLAMLIATETVGSLQDSALAGHNHSAGTLGATSAGAHTHHWRGWYNTSDDGDGRLLRSHDWNSDDAPRFLSTDGAHTHPVGGSTGSTGLTENRPVNVAVSWVKH